MAVDTSEIKANVDCRLLAENLLGQKPVQESARAWQWLCPFHTDKDTPSFTVYYDGYKCFGCGAGGDQISLVMQLEGLNFSEACAYLSQFWGKHQPIVNRPIYISRPTNRVLWQDRNWQTTTYRIVQVGISRLPGSPGEDYLARRGISPETSRAFALGYEPDFVIKNKEGRGWVEAEKPGPAIIIPWLAKGVVQAVQYRFVQNSLRRFHQKYGGERIVYGIDQLAGRDVLVVIEGELNAISVWQTSRDVVDVVSFGSESNIDRAAPAIGKISERYDHVIVWADKPNQALQALVKIHPGGTALQSPGGLDANDLLRRNQLAEFINAVLADIGVVVQVRGADEPMDQIGLSFPVNSSCVTIHGKWQRLEDGRIEASYTRVELLWAMMATGYEPSEEELALLNES